jgi:hypothetical protein
LAVERPLLVAGIPGRLGEGVKRGLQVVAADVEGLIGSRAARP